MLIGFLKEEKKKRAWRKKERKKEKEKGERRDWSEREVKGEGKRVLLLLAFHADLKRLILL